MEQPVLTDPDLFPTDEVLKSHLRRATASYRSLLQYNHSTFPDFVERWKYYNDGKSWLLNVSRKRKTLFWLGVREGSFRTTFYFGAKGAPDLLNTDLPKELRAQFRSSTGRKFRGVTAVIRTKKDVDVYRKLLALKIESMSR